MRTFEPTLYPATTTVAAMPRVSTDTQLRARLQHSLGGVYTLERELSGAGMARVFVADEPALGRKVVLKVMPSEVTQYAAAERLHGEIKLSASLQQANIIPVFSAGIAAGLPYYTMPLVEERSLAELLSREGPLPIARGVGILRDVARALAYAHAHGVVHRDIKPGNILLSGGSAVVADFGIAKLVGSGAEAVASATGLVSGTPDYMAPEQATGDAPNHRVDIYSFGCLAYALFTGKPPFPDRSAWETIAAHLRAAPTPLAALRPDVPFRIAALIARCLQKDPAKRPQSANELLEELEMFDPADVGRPSRRLWTYLIAFGAIAAALLGMAN